jgi:hypothetical protein
MELPAALFGLALIALSAVVAYQWGIKPDRENRKRRAEELNELRRQRQRLAPRRHAHH